ncbi:hypothetical protein EXE10_10150 [Acinetobacter sp. WCHAc060033]|uniref:hypothetical protein n=1 Tax=Acinetobacter sp. WCHAc060033 TaxID=2518624 RepID=UPI001023A6CE|nr:hypothetical protein [Acinetobacter sp. WCHAc060033]RZG84024.1 hypothetical protein EXE10_10150 [Acinetobacter sp. WCHAc060033]
MLKFKDYFQKLYRSFPLERFLNFFVACMIVGMIILATLALLRPISPTQYKNVLAYSDQAAYPKTQVLAKKLSQQERISVAEYFRLLRAYYYEKQGIKKYPAVDVASSK